MIKIDKKELLNAIIHIGCILMILLIIIMLCVMLSKCNNNSSNTLICSTCYTDTIIPLDINSIEDIVYNAKTKTFWIETSAVTSHYISHDAAYELIWDYNHPDSIHHTYFIEYNRDGETEIVYMD